MNKVIIIGRLTNEVEMRYTKSTNTPVAKFSVAVNRKYAREGEERETDFFNVLAWGKLSEIVNKYLRKGMQTAIIGRLENRKYEDKNGVTKQVTEIIADDIEFIERKKEPTDIDILTGNTNKEEYREPIDFPDNNDDLPF